MEFAEALYEYIYPNDYWIFIVPWSNQNGLAVISNIEKKFYMADTEANRDFILCFLPKMGSIVAAKKSRLPIEELNKEMKGNPEGDIFCCASEELIESEMKFFQYVQTELATIDQIRREK